MIEVTMIRKIHSVFFIVIILLAQNLLIYPQEKTSRISPERPNSDHKNNIKESPGKIKNEIYRAYQRNTKNYFKIDNSGMSLWNGKHWVPDNFPLRIYVEESKSDQYSTIYKDYIEYGFKIWQQADSRIKYHYVNSPDRADIIIIFEENLMDKYEENFLGLTDYELGPDRQIEVSTVEISLLKYNDEKLSDGEIKATIIHEIGHALGLGHSSNSADLMYPYIDPDSSSELNYDELSTGDTEAIRSVIDLSYQVKYTWY
jgi:predicted Zn-dependent protease